MKNWILLYYKKSDPNYVFFKIYNDTMHVSPQAIMLWTHSGDSSMRYESH